MVAVSENLFMTFLLSMIKYIFVEEQRALIAKIEHLLDALVEVVLKWCRLIEKGVSVRKLCFIGNELAVCGEKFLGFFDSEIGEALWLVECASELTDMCLSDHVVFCAGYRGCFALVCRDCILVEKSLEVKGESTWSKPWIEGVCCTKGEYILAGYGSNLILSNWDSFVCSLDENLNPCWCTGFSGYRGFVLTDICCDSENVYFAAIFSSNFIVFKYSWLNYLDSLSSSYMREVDLLIKCK